MSSSYRESNENISYINKYLYKKRNKICQKYMNFTDKKNIQTSKKLRKLYSLRVQN